MTNLIRNFVFDRNGPVGIELVGDPLGFQGVHISEADRCVSIRGPSPTTKTGLLLWKRDFPCIKGLKLKTTSNGIKVVLVGDEYREYIGILCRPNQIDQSIAAKWVDEVNITVGSQFRPDDNKKPLSSLVVLKKHL